MALITAADIKLQARFSHAEDDALLADLAAVSSEAIYDYLKRRDLSPSEEQTAKVAAMHLAATLYENWQGSGGDAFGNYGDMPKPVQALLYRLRHPALS